jgi:Ni/Fe-hydrogenase b-type cytochrome subunit
MTNDNSEEKKDRIPAAPEIANAEAAGSKSRDSATVAAKVATQETVTEVAPAPGTVAGQDTPVDAVASQSDVVERPETEPVAEMQEPELVRAAYEHPLPIRITHWVNAISLFVMITSGLRIFRAFPSFGPKIPQKVLIDIPKSLTLGGWLGGALQWHFTFMWFFAASGLVYAVYQVASGHFRTMLFVPRDIAGVWPMARHYFFFGPKPPATGQYNPLQKLAYTSTIGFGLLSLLTGIVLYKPAQFSWLAFLFGGFHLTRIWHFAAMCGFLSFIPGHLIMVALHGWSNFVSMLSGWKREPEYQE